ncbi:MAG TPA: heavy metal translocating P-type ATPase, partial [Chloroflexota bacterium]|nr:heavy metal translocating P-type ATPase [Chloroflexota bacterium]
MKTKHHPSTHTDEHAGHAAAHEPESAPAPGSEHAREAEEQLKATTVHGHPEMAHDTAAHGDHHAPMTHDAHSTPAAHGDQDAHGTHGGHDAHGAHGGRTGQAGHSGHAGHSEAIFARPFWISLILTIPVLIYGEILHMLFEFHPPAFPGSSWLVPVLSSVIYWYGGWVFLTGAVSELRALRPGMMTLVALAITSAYAYSLAITFGLTEGMSMYWELATLVTIMLLGHWMEMRAVGSAQGALTELAKLLPDTAERLVNGRTEQVLVSELRHGDVVLVRPGMQIPADGVV